MAVRQYSQALTLLESIPQRHRTPKVNMRLGRLYQQAGMERPAITAYKEVLKVTSKSALACLQKFRVHVSFLLTCS